MRNASNFEDCNNLFRELFGELDKLRSQDMDMRKRRVVNASPSVHTYDYVVRKELLDAIQAVEGTPGSTESVVSTSRYYTIVFTTAGTVRTAAYASGPYIFKRQSSTVIACVSAVVVPTVDASFNLLHNGVAILANDLVLPATAASLEVVSSTNFTPSVVTFSADDTLVLSVTAGGNAAKLTVELLVREV